MGRRSGMTAENKKFLISVFVKFHKLHFGPGIIAECTGYSPQYVRRILDDQGLKERWHDSGDVLRSIDATLAAEAMRLRDKAIVN